MKRTQTTPVAAIPPGTEALFSVTCKDVVLGRGSGTQNHCGNVTYRKLVYLNKELYATSSKFDKLKISKAIVAAVRAFDGKFVQADQKRGGMYYDIGDKRAWEKTSQALREGQAEIREQLAAAHPSGTSKIAEYKQVISEQTFFAYACRMLESLYHTDSVTGLSACGQLCPHAKRRETLNQLGVDPMKIHNAMQSLARATQGLPPPLMQLPQPQDMQPQQSHVQHAYNSGMLPPGAFAASTAQTQNQKQPFQAMKPLTFDNMYVNSVGVASAPVAAGGIEHLPYASEPPNTSTLPGYFQRSLPPKPTELPSNNVALAYSNSPAELSALKPNQARRGAVVVQGNPLEPLPFQRQSDGGDQKPEYDPDFIDSVFSLRQLCSSTDLQKNTEEGKTLLEHLNKEVDDLIRRKSYALLQIDTGHAFEDLVFEDDSVVFDRSKSEEILPPKKGRGSDSSSNRSRRTSSSSKLSRMSSKDDMSLVSLMNMSILSLDERGYDSDGHSRKTFTSTKKKEKHKPRVSWPEEPNISLMSLDDRSFRQLLDCICDPDDGADRDKNFREKHKVSRKIGFPIGRNSFFDQYQSASDPNIGPVSAQPLSGANRMKDGSDCKPSRFDRSSFDRIAECDDSLHACSFSRLAGQVENPGTDSSLRLNGTRNSSASKESMNFSQMSMLSTSEFDIETLFKDPLPCDQGAVGDATTRDLFGNPFPESSSSEAKGPYNNTSS